MPYITQENRVHYIPLIEDIILNISKEQIYIQPQYFGYFCKNLFLLVSGCNLNTGIPCFDSEFFDEKTKINIFKNTKKISDVVLSSVDMYHQAGELNYVCSAVLWGLLGDSLRMKSAKYGVRAFFKGILWEIYHGFVPSVFHVLENVPVLNKRLILFKGVITDIIDEMYRRKTSFYEEEKIVENGDIWPLKKVDWVEHCPISGPVGEEELE